MKVVLGMGDDLDRGGDDHRGTFAGRSSMHSTLEPSLRSTGQSSTGGDFGSSMGNLLLMVSVGML